MAYDGWVEFGGREFINLSRTAQLAETLGIDTVWTDPASVAWIENALSGTGYDQITEAPWYDPGYPASAEFAGLVPLSLAGLDDSSRESSTIEYVTDGGSSGKPRSKTLPIVASIAIVASTERGAEFGRLWLNRMLSHGGSRSTCSGSEMRYFRFTPGAGEPVPPMAHRRDVTLSRGTSVTRKRATHCSATWLVTFTLTANDPFEYGEEQVQFTGLGGTITEPAGDTVSSFGSQSMVEVACPVYDYTPVYDPMYPALVASPTAPDFYPAGWTLLPGVAFTRYWARLNPVEPTTLNVVPVFTLTSDIEARMVRVSVWPADSAPDDTCEPLWTATLTYLPPAVDFVIDAEQEASYVWDRMSPQVRRTDSLVYGTGARPLHWTSFNDPEGLLVTLDVVSGGSASIRAALSFVSKSD